MSCCLDPSLLKHHYVIPHTDIHQIWMKIISGFLLTTAEVFFGNAVSKVSATGWSLIMKVQALNDFDS